MSFTWPFALLLALTVPLVLGAYLLAMRRRRHEAVTYSSLALLRQALPRRSRWRRHVPLGMVLASLVVLAIAAARPQITSNVAVGRTSIILALDESGSMCSTDVRPNRLSVAQKAARQFVDAQPSGVRTGLVIFSGFAELAVAPTRDRNALDKAIDNLSTSNGTAIGAAMLKALDAIAEADPRVEPVGNAVSNGAAASPTEGGAGSSGAAGPTTGAAARPGTNGYVPDIVVLLTDGANTQGIAPLDAVPYAVARRVRVYTIGFGTSHPGPLACTAQQTGGEAGPLGFGGGPGGGFNGGGGGRFGGFAGGRSPLVVDLPTLQKISARTGGASYSAQDAPQLAKVFANLPKDVATQKSRHEISDIFAAIGALLGLAALAASIRWSPRP